MINTSDSATLFNKMSTMLNLRRLGGLAFAFGNVLFVLNKVDEMSRIFLRRPRPDLISGQNGGLIVVGQLALILGYLAYYHHYAHKVLQGGKYALGLFCAGGIILALGHLTFISGIATMLPSALVPYADALFLMVVAGLLVLLLGLGWFGVLNLRTPVLQHWPWLPLATSLMGAVGFFMFSGEVITAPFLIFRTLFAFGLLGLGVILSLERS